MTIKTGDYAPWHRHGLPAEVTSFVGRRREVADVKAMLGRARLVTLTGVGGVGKTRLAYRAAADLLRAFPDGVWLVELAGIEHPGCLVPALAETFCIQRDSNRPIMDSLADHLREMRALLILDNCEHVVQECASLAQTLLRAAPPLRILATSRQVLGTPGEQTFVVPALALPQSGPLPIASFAEYDAVRLFAERAQAVLPGFTVTEENQEAIERICRRLDGIPLAIELAAVRLRALSVGQLLDRLDDRFRLLEWGSRTEPPRHRTLWALIDWSHALCTPQERSLWARASVFVGGMDLEAAEAVCSGEGIAREEVLNLVTGLVDKSVLLREDHPRRIRYRLPDSLREYGRSRLAATGEEAAVRDGYLAFYRRLCADTRARLFGPSQEVLFARLKLESTNLRSVMDQCLSDSRRVADGLAMAADLRNHWITGHLSEGARQLEKGLALYPTPDVTRARALVVSGLLTTLEGRPGPAVELLDEAGEIAARLDRPEIVADVALHRGLAALAWSEAEAAVACCEDAVRRFRAVGELMGLARALMWLTAAYTLRGDLWAAAATAEEGIALCEACGDDLIRTYQVTMLAIVLWRAGETGRARELAKESLDVNRALGNPRGIGFGLAVLVWIAATDGEYDRAARLLGILDTFSQRPRARPAIGALVAGYRHLHGYHDRSAAETRHALGDTAFEAELRWSDRLDVGQALAYAMEETDVTDEPWRPTSLTPRETEVARLVAQGMSNKEIAAQLVISQRTAEGHVEHILAKLGFASRTQIALWAEPDARQGPARESRAGPGGPRGG
ncbi:LuxR C-terminal-related transcriptional regulator [Actinomadura sp. DC4]|uniref:ATP-binding protein n=1 Tax=Actinomadura sp. DC4 TaxID=3055069 RepID=UPI0025B19136|nr:LuxR C-terminal-related transcriptional regulator [Actinomadura sp. DC4]MDN3356620.1 LuxR C-terminal-related transcriptional regulator [Actinomadura sp. DC4]